MRYKQLASALMLPLLLTGCWKDQQQATDACLAQNPFRSAYPPRADVKTPMTRCMDSKGYVTDFDNSYCRDVAYPRRSAYCYAPKGFFNGAGHRLEMLFVEGPNPPHDSSR